MLNRFASLLSTSVAAVLVFAFITSGCTKKFSDTDTTINYVAIANVKGLDPIRANDLYSSTVISQIFEGLLEYNYLKRPLTLQPGLADGMPVASADGLTHTFKIKKGVKFQDNPCFKDGKGREVTAQDFIYSWKRLSDPKLGSEGFWIFDGKIKGLNEWVEGMKSGKATYDSPIEGFSTPDDHTIVIKLIKPYYQLYDVLAMAFSMVEPKEAVDKYGEEFLNNPVGTGPFMLKQASDWVHNSKITLVKNPTFHGETYPTEGMPGDKEAGLLDDAGKQLPFADKLVFTELIENTPRWQNLVKGNFDYAEIPNDNFAGAVDKNDHTKLSKELTDKGMWLQVTPNVEVTYTGINMKDPILGKNKLLRQALALSQDTPGLIANLYNGGIVAQSPIPPGVDGYDPNYKNPYQTHDLAKAKALLAKAGYPDGKGLPEFNYDCLSATKDRQITEFLIQQWANIGIKVKITPNTWPQFQEKIKNGKVQFFGIAWGADYPDAQDFFQLFYSKNMSPGPNDTSYSNPEFDKVYEQALATPPGPARNELYKKMRDIVVEDSPWLFNLTRNRYNLIHGWLHNFKWNDIALDLPKYWRVDPKQRSEMAQKL